MVCAFAGVKQIRSIIEMIVKLFITYL